MKNLKPREIWGYFDEILKIPRLSKQEEQINAYLEEFARKHALDFSQDAAGNCLITKAATKGYENHQPIILQSHVDMVGEKLMDIEHDFTKDPIETFEQDGWITAKGTTLGADDGIGIAASMAVLASNDIAHGPLECLFTVDEETGMTGAFGLEAGFMKGKILLNLDSEDEGEIFIGCAGGIDTIGRIKKKVRASDPSSVALGFTIEGLQGGHSGDEIHKGFGNSIKLMTRLLWNITNKFKVSLSHFEGGKLRNAIPREASATLVIDPAELESVKLYFASFLSDVSLELQKVEPGFKMTMEELPLPENCFERDFQRDFLNVLYSCPHGVIAWSQEIEGLVETSSNLAVVKDLDSDYIEVVTSQRSSVESAKKDIADRLAAVFQLGNFEVRHTDGYPGWKPNTNSPILAISTRVYKKLFHKDPEVKAIHAGLECGLFLEKYPYLDMISFGPTIKGAHTPDEKIHIESVTKFWKFLLEMLKNAPKN